VKLNKRGLTAALITAALLTGVYDGNAANGAGAQARPLPQTMRQFNGADVVFMVDQSGSMGGADFGSSRPDRPPTDPDNMRFQAVEFGIDWVGNFRAAQAALGNELDIQVATVYFGDSVVTPLPLTPITADNPQDWQNERANLINPVSLDTFGYRNLGNTDFIGGFERALTELRAADTRRLQIVIVLTDGAPCAPERFTDRNCETRSDQTDHMEQLEQLVNRQFGGSNQQVYAIALDATNAYWGRFADYWLSITDNQAEQLENPLDMGVRLNDILETYFTGLEDDSGGVTEAAPEVRALGINQQQRLYADGLVAVDVQPYQQLMTVTLFKSERTSRLTIVDPTNASVSASRGDVFVTGEDTLIETWQIANPLPGRWVLGSRLDAQGVYADLSPNFRLKFVRALFSFRQPLNQQQQYIPYEYTISVTDADGAPLANYADAAYRLVGEVHVTRPDGSTVNLPLAPGSEPGQYRAPFTPFSDGMYSATVTAYVGAAGGAAIFSAAPGETVRVVPTFVTIDGLPERVLENIPQTYQLRFEQGNGDPLAGIDVQQFVVALLPPESANCAQTVTATAAEGYERFDDFDLVSGVPTIRAVHQALGEHVVCVRAAVRDTADPTRASHVVYDGVYGDSLTVIGLQPLMFTAALADRAVSPGVEIALPQEVSTDVPLLDSYPDLPIKRPFWSEAAFMLNVTVRDKRDNAPFDLLPLAAAANNPTPFTLEILNAANQRVQTDLVIAPTDNESVWSVIIPTLPTGRYTVTISTSSQQYGEDRAFHPDDAALTFPLVITPNYEHQAVINGGLIGATVGGGVLLLALTAGAVSFVGQRIGAISGTLILLRGPKGAYDPNEAQTVRTITLPGGRNRYTVPLTELPLIDPPMTELSVRGVRGRLRVKFGVNGAPRETDIDEGRVEELFDFGRERFFLWWKSQS
jgi:hypothetical protein